MPERKCLHTIMICSAVLLLFSSGCLNIATEPTPSSVSPKVEPSHPSEIPETTPSDTEESPDMQGSGTVQNDAEYPAIIIGYVIVSDTLKEGTAIPTPPNDESEIFWIVKIYINNIGYKAPIEASYMEGGWTKWRMIANGSEYVPQGIPYEPLIVAVGETASFICYFRVPANLEVDDAQLRYTGQEPYSFGTLVFEDKVKAYDWDSHSVMDMTGETGEPPSQLEEYLLMTFFEPNKTMMLRTIAEWYGNSSRRIDFTANQTPWVLNAGRVSTSKISTKFNVIVWQEADKYQTGTLTLEKTYGPFAGVQCAIIESTGDYIIEVDSSGCEWWVKIGIE